MRNIKEKLEHRWNTLDLKTENTTNTTLRRSVIINTVYRHDNEIDQSCFTSIRSKLLTDLYSLWYNKLKNETSI